jgi:hypothetical protein
LAEDKLLNSPSGKKKTLPAEIVTEKIALGGFVTLNGVDVKILEVGYKSPENREPLINFHKYATIHAVNSFTLIYLARRSED